MSDHIPFVMVLDCDSLPEMSQEVNSDVKAKLDWSKLTYEDVMLYFGRTDGLLQDVYLPRDVILCSNVNCKDSSHCNDLCTMYNSIAEAVYEASRPFFTQSKKRQSIKPGWNKYVSAYHAEAKNAYKVWVLEGRPREGPVLDHKKLTNARYKYAVRYISKHEQEMRADSMAEFIY